MLKYDLNAIWLSSAQLSTNNTVKPYILAAIYFRVLTCCEI